ncbi:MAG: hypothetical protein FJX76_09235 [Armatimonadetes bacterium]|nr:hypothetical protein [Armatimonadota bacterium]
MDEVARLVRNAPHLLEAPDHHGWMLIHHASHLRQPRAVETLLSLGSSPNLLSAAGVSPLQISMASRDLGSVAVLLAAGADVHERLDDRGQTPLHVAVVRRDPAMVALLLRHGADAHKMDFRYATPWGIAAKSECASIFDMLDAVPTPQELEIARHVPSAVRDEGRVPRPTAVTRQLFGLPEVCLIRAVERGDRERVHELLSGSATVKTRDENQRPLLLVAAAAGDVEVARMLLEHGADIHAANKETHQTALHAAAASGHDAMLRLLLSYGAVREARDCNGRTPLHLAAQAGHVLAVSALLSATCYVDALDADGRTPLHLAACLRGRGDRVSMCALLLGRGASWDIRDKAGTAVHDLAAACPQTLEMLPPLRKESPAQPSGDPYCRINVHLRIQERPDTLLAPV